jgi:hypothetical protein
VLHRGNHRTKSVILNPKPLKAFRPCVKQDTDRSRITVHTLWQVVNNYDRGVAQPGSASALGAEGRRFKSSRPDQIRHCARGCLWPPSRSAALRAESHKMSPLTEDYCHGQNFRFGKYSVNNIYKISKEYGNGP